VRVMRKTSSDLGCFVPVALQALPVPSCFPSALEMSVCLCCLALGSTAFITSLSQDGSLQCPTCKTIYGVKTGTQPPGKMEYHIIPHALPGHSDCKTIRIIYNIPPGVQVRPGGCLGGEPSLWGPAALPLLHHCDRRLGGDGFGAAVRVQLLCG